MKGFALGLLNFLLFLSLTALGLAFMLNLTILNPDFVIAELDKVDTPSLVKPLIKEQIQIPPEAQFMAATIDDTIDKLEPVIKEQVNAGIYSGYDYLLGRSESLNIEISMEPIKESLRDTLKEALLQSPPPELAGLPPAEIEQYFDQVYQEFSKQIPSTFEVNESSLSPEFVGTLEQIRQGIGYFQIGYKALIGLIALLILGIILINRQVRASTRSIGITSLVVGVFGFVEPFLVNRFAEPLIAQLGIPAQLQTWIPQLLNDFLAPLQMYSIGLLAAGVTLIIVSHVYKPRQSYAKSE